LWWVFKVFLRGGFVEEVGEQEITSDVAMLDFVMVDGRKAF
jgi:hypothetical protein